jgi:ABC-2 type transport system permease protein
VTKTWRSVELPPAAHRRWTWHAALWRKAVADSWRQLVVTAALLVLFAWLFVWLMSLFSVGAWTRLFDWLPDAMQGFIRAYLGVELVHLASTAGRISFLYLHVVTVLLFFAWAVGRGSDTVSGSISAGTMEFLVTLPIRRVWVLVVPSVVSTVGVALLAASLWLGTWIGITVVDLEDDLSIWQFLPGAVNLFSMGFCLAGATTLFSSFDRDRWRTIWLAVGFFVVSAIVKLVSRMWEPGAWLRYFSFLTTFEPQQLILHDDAWSASIGYNAPLLGVGLACYVAAAIVFTWRDIPVPR